MKTKTKIFRKSSTKNLLFHFSAQFLFTANEVELVNVRVASQVAERLKT